MTIGRGEVKHREQMSDVICGRPLIDTLLMHYQLELR